MKKILSALIVAAASLLSVSAFAQAPVVVVHPPMVAQNGHHVQRNHVQRHHVQKHRHQVQKHRAHRHARHHYVKPHQHARPHRAPHGPRH